MKPALRDAVVLQPVPKGGVQTPAMKSPHSTDF
jgi:hypothetical protein